MSTITRRITNTTGTIPDSIALAGTVTTDTVTTVLIYTGSDDILALVNDGNSNYPGFTYIVVPSATPKIVRILGVYLNDNDTVSITVETAMAGLSDAPCDFVYGDLTGLSYLNDGGTDITVDGISIPDGQGISLPPFQFTSMGELRKPLYVVATGSDVLITETK
jgi:hypothetical protein